MTSTYAPSSAPIPPAAAPSVPAKPVKPASLLAHLRTAFLATLVLTVLVGGIYPLVVWAAAQLIFPNQANGSLLRSDGKVIGSALFAQAFSSPGYFHPRPSAAGNGYDPTASGGSNLGPTSNKLINGQHRKTADGKADPGNMDGVKDLLAAYRAENGLDAAVRVPVDAVTRSASGLDPHISLANALLQAPRVAKARHLDLAQVQRLIAAATQGPDLGFLGEAGVNVLLLNLALDGHH